MSRTIQAGLWLLAAAGVGLLLLASDSVLAGPCMDESGAACLIAVVFGTPAGAIFLVVGGIQAWLQSRKNSAIHLSS